MIEKLIYVVMCVCIFLHVYEFVCVCVCVCVCVALRPIAEDFFFLLARHNTLRCLGVAG